MFAFKDHARRATATTALLCTAAAAFSVTGAPALAQDDDEEGIEEIVVTSRYREERLQETPIAVTAISAADIEVRALTEGYQVGYVVPNASLRPAQAAFGNTMTAYIRGIGQYDFNFAFEPGVGIYFDDIYYPVTMGSMVDLMDLERVEVLRGPQGTLFGRGSLGGAIRYVSKQPTGDGSGEIRVTTGSFSRMDVRGSYDFALSDSISARVTGMSKSRDGHQNVYDWGCLNPNVSGTEGSLRNIANRGSNCKVGTQGGESVTGGRAIVRFEFNDDMDFTFTADLLDDNSEARADTLVAIATNEGGPFDGQLPVPFNFWEDRQFDQYGVRLADFLPPDIYTSYATYDDPESGLDFRPETSIRQEGYSGKFDWSMNNDMRLEAILSYREFDGAFATDTDQGPVGLQTVDGRQTAEMFTGELRLSGRAMDMVDWTIGAFYYQGDFTSAQTVSIPAFVPGILVNGNNIDDHENNSLFAHTVWDLTDQLAITLGARYSEDTKDVDFDNSIVVTTNSAEDDSFDWKVGIDYQMSEDILLYASAATGYRPQAFNPRPFQVTQFVPVDGEENVSYDIGIKSDLLDNRVRLNLAAFYIDYKQRILPVGGTECLLIPGSDPPQYDTVPPGTPGAVTDSLGNTCLAVTSRTFYDNIPAEITGVELEAQWQPVDGLLISGIYGYTDFSGDEFEDPSILLPPGEDWISDRPTYVPESNWSLSASYNVPLSNGSSLAPRLDVYGQTEICPTLTNTLSNPTITDAQRCTADYELINARVDWRSPGEDWLIAVGVTNLADEEYFLNKFDLTAFGQPSIEGQPGRPREWYLTLQRNFQ